MKLKCCHSCKHSSNWLISEKDITESYGYCEYWQGMCNYFGRCRQYQKESRDEDLEDSFERGGL